MVQTGIFVATAVIDETGTPCDIAIEHSLHTFFDRAAVAAIRQWRFLPGRHWDRPARYSVIFTASHSSAEKALPTELTESIDPPSPPPKFR
jgi:TonB family protein